MARFLVTCPHDTEEPHRIYYELYGNANAPHKLIFTMGLGGTWRKSFLLFHIKLTLFTGQWQPQLDYFTQFPDKYQVLVYDNRGMGLSDAVAGRWTTKKMAMDAIRLLVRVGWTGPTCNVHVIGLSLGGMISQELCRLAERYDIHVKSLTLLSTIAGGVFSLYYFVLSIPTGLQLTARTFLTRDANTQLKNGLALLYPTKFLESEGKHPETGQPVQNFKLFRRALIKRGLQDKENGNRGHSIVSVIKQGFAVFGHSVSQQEFDYISRKLKGNVLVLTGDEDILVHPANAGRLHRELAGSELVEMKGAGHGANEQNPELVNAAIERIILKSEEHSTAKL